MKKFLPALALCFISASGNQSPEPCSYGKDTSSNKEDPSQSADWILTTKVKEAILADSSLSPSNRFVSVSTTDGVVTLTGEVSNQQQMDEIVKKASKISGVKKVKNQMTLAKS